MSRVDYRTYSIGGRPVFAAPPALCASALRRLQPSTPKRAAYRWLAALGMRLSFTRLMSRAGPLALGKFDLVAWLAALRSELSVAGLEAAVFWPPQPQRGRVYAHLFDGERPVAFAKLCLDGSNAASLAREAQTLRILQGQPLRRCRVPQVLAQGEGWLVLEPLPASARPLPARPESYPAEAVREYAGERRYTASTEGLSWWPRFRSRLDARADGFLEELMRKAPRESFAVCRMHGDLSVHNCVRDRDALWIFDWEESAPDAPCLSDEVGFALSLGRRFSSPRRLDLMLALAFRCAAGIPDALALVHRWRPVP